MHKTDLNVTIVVGMFAGFMGAVVSHHLVIPNFAVAQEGTQRTKVMEVESLRLVDQAGKIRGAFELAPDGTVGLAMGNKDGVARLRLVVDQKGTAAVDLRDEKNQSHAVLMVNALGSPTLIMQDKSTNSRAVLGETTLLINEAGITAERPAGSLLIFNKDGKVIWRTPER